MHLYGNLKDVDECMHIYRFSTVLDLLSFPKQTTENGRLWLLLSKSWTSRTLVIYRLFVFDGIVLCLEDGIL
jgi:hypothetical protein